MLHEPQLLPRRDVLRAGLFATGAVICAPAVLPAAPPTNPAKLTFGAPLTHCDWMLKDNRPEVVWGIEGVRHMLSVCKAAGISQVYWRVLDAGRAMYKSRLVLPGENYEFNEFYNPLTKEEKGLLDSFHM